MRRLTGSDLFDVALGASLAAALVAITRGLDAAVGERLLDAVAYACLVVAGASLAVRRRFPAVALLLASAAVGVYAAALGPGGGRRHRDRAAARARVRSIDGRLWADRARLHGVGGGGVAFGGGEPRAARVPGGARGAGPILGGEPRAGGAQ